MDKGEDLSRITHGKVINDCIHGNFSVPPLCIAIMDTPEFQRLRNIKQMSMGYFVYPGACHNRFEHSLGVCYLAGEMVDALNHTMQDLDMRVTDSEKLCVQVAGLCHDLGHGPFSHTWEKFLLRARPHKDHWRHEEQSIVMFNEILKSGKVKEAFVREKLKESDIEFIRCIINGKGTPPRENMDFLYEIINNQRTGIDVDKWDYFLRDGHQLNLNVTFDYRRLLLFLRVMTTSDGIHICYNSKEANSIYQMFLVRAEMHFRAYQHRVVKVLEEMLLDALLLADRGGYEIQGYHLSEIHEHPEVFTLLTDHIFYHILCIQSKSLQPARDLITRIHKRELYQYITIKHINFQPEQAGVNFQELMQHKLDEDWKEVCVYKVEMGVEDKNLLNNWFFNKSDPKTAFRKNWEEVPVFPIRMDMLHHIDLLIFSKVELDEQQFQRLKKRVDNIQLAA